MSLLRRRWLALAGVLLLLALWVLGNLEPTRTPDSDTYLEFDFSSVQVSLSQIRTPVYPLIVRTIGNVNAIPVFHTIAYILSCLLFCQGLMQAGFRKPVAVFCSLILLPGRAVFDLAGLIQADSLAISSAVAVTGCFLGCLGENSHRGWWLGLAVGTLLTCLIRPAYLFLIPLWPVLGWLLDRFLLRRATSWKVRRIRLSGYIVATVFPILLWCTVRFLVVGHWGLVSFGGYNVVGVAGQFVDSELVQELPDDLKSLGQGIVAGRQQLPHHDPPDSFAAMEIMFNPTVWVLAVPQARKLTQGDGVATNQLLSRFSWEVLKRRPRRYLQWLAWNANHARIEITRLVVSDKGTLLLLLIVMIVHALALLRTRHDLPPGTAHERSQRYREAQLIFWIALGFTAAKTCLVILVEPAVSRYMTGASCLLPAVLAVWAAHGWESYFSPRSDS